MLALSTLTIRAGNVLLRLRPPQSSAGTGTVVNLPIEGVEGTLDSDGLIASIRAPAIGFEEDESKWDVLEPLRLVENVDYQFSIETPFPKAEFNQRRIDSENPVWPFANLKLGKAVVFNSPEACREIGSQYLITGHLKFDNQIGSVDLSLAPDAYPLFLRAEVTTQKIDYEHDFYRLLSALDQVHRELILQLDSATEVKLFSETDESRSPHSTILQLRRILQPNVLPHAVATILENPVSRYESHRVIEASAFVTAPDLLELQSRPTNFSWISGGPLAESFSGFTPVTLPARRIERSFDTQENRFVKFALQQLLRLLDECFSQISKSHLASRKQLRKWTVLIDELLLHPFWQQIGVCTEHPSSMAFHERSGYRDFIQSINDLELSLGVESRLDAFESTSGDLRPIWELYEFWCYLQLREILVSITGDRGVPELSSVVTKRKCETAIQVGDPGRTCFKFQHAGTAVEIELYFTRLTKPEFQSDCVWLESYSTKFRPDYSVLIKAHGNTHWIHFDAKYKVSMPKSAGQPHSYRSEDIDTMHMYRDAILGTRGCYVLFPGDSTEPTIYVRHPSSAYRSKFSGPGVGAFPLCPGDEAIAEAQTSKLASHIRLMVEAAATHQHYQEEDGWL
ncbi:MAG: putative component of viral defense system (DUF524 family) [Planctomycetaceae bacterium]|jgi:predicted component of viral defense system (DUF524 family)